MEYTRDSLLHASKSASIRQFQYKQTFPPLPPFPPSHPENRMKYSVILCCLHRNTDLIITSRLADAALHLQLCDEFFREDKSRKKKKRPIREENERTGYGD